MNDIHTGYLQKDGYDYVETVVYETKVPSRQAMFAMVLVEKWGMVAAIDDGEDSAGRQKIRLQTPAEVVQRAWETAVAMFATLEAEGHMLTIPAPYVKKKDKVGVPA